MASFRNMVVAALLVALQAASSDFDPSKCDKSYTFDVRDWVVDYKRPTALPRAAPYAISDANKKAAILVNNTYPGPAIEATEVS
jgi:hypothetical protein